MRAYLRKSQALLVSRDDGCLDGFRVCVLVSVCVRVLA